MFGTFAKHRDWKSFDQDGGAVTHQAVVAAWVGLCKTSISDEMRRWGLQPFMIAPWSQWLDSYCLRTEPSFSGVNPMLTLDTVAQKFQAKGRSLFSWAAPVLVKIWISAAFFLR